MLNPLSVAGLPEAFKAVYDAFEERTEIKAAIAAVRAKPDTRYCCPGRWRVYSCPLTGMVVVERSVRPKLAKEA